MKLFFETASQAQLFLIMLPIGMFLALVADLASGAGVLRPLWDVFAMLLSFGAIGTGIVMFRDSGLRMYHFLAVIVGMLLYILGIRAALSRIKTEIFGKVRKERRKRGNICRINKENRFER